MAVIDFHCHLDLYDDPIAIAREAARRQVYVLSVTTTPSAFAGTARLAPPGSRIRTALGLHPELAVARERELPQFERHLPRTAYVGEIGLDGSKPHRSTLDRQAGIFMDILMLSARAGGRVLSIHSRDARKLLLDLLEVEPMAGTPILHWFSGTESEVQRAADMGCWFSVGPSMLASARGRAVAAAMPKDKILPETDGPFGMDRGRAHFPWDAKLVNPTLSNLWRDEERNVEQQLLANLKTMTEVANKYVPQARDRLASDTAASWP